MASPTEEDELAFISGVTNLGRAAATSFQTWNGDIPATYDGYSYASKWGASRLAGTSGGTVSYAFDPGSNWTAAEQTALREGLSLWSAVANISFVQTAQGSGATLTFTRGTDGEAFEDGPNSGYEAVGSSQLATQGSGTTISIDTSARGFGPLGSFATLGGYPVETVVHEEGHFLGLGHSGPYNDDDDERVQQDSAFDTRLWSVMSYIEPETADAKYFAAYPVAGTAWRGSDPTTWMPLDILAAQRLYGVATTTPLSGGQVFGYDTNIAGDLRPFFDFTQNTTPVVTLWDAGSGNTLDLSGCTTPCAVNLNAGAFSSFDGMTNNLAIAYQTAIDGAVGGSGDDLFAVNADADTIDGGAGINTVVFAGSRAQYRLSQSDGVIKADLLATGVTDTLVDIQSLQFSDQTVASNTVGPLSDVFYVDGSQGVQSITGLNGYVNVIGVANAYGFGTVLADLKDGLVSKGGTLDATVANVQGATLGADPAVVLGVTAGGDLLYGGGGADSFYNEGGTDVISGGSGSNAIVGGSGTSIFYGTGGADEMTGGTGESFMQAGPTATSIDVFYGAGGNDFVDGGAGRTTLYGAGGTEKLTGGSGFSELIGSTRQVGADIVDGGSGTDRFYAGIGTNLLYEATGTDVLAGNAGIDIVYGGSGRSFVYGGTGTDVVTTGAGDQYLKAGSGTTVFNDTAAHLTAGRFDQIDEFAGGETDLYLPAAVQGATRFVSENGGTAVLTSVAGGAAEVFASGTAAETVQAHTHFTL